MKMPGRRMLGMGIRWEFGDSVVREGIKRTE
jgi:hypothetical protein